MTSPGDFKNIMRVKIEPLPGMLRGVLFGTPLSLPNPKPFNSNENYPVNETLPKVGVITDLTQTPFRYLYLNGKRCRVFHGHLPEMAKFVSQRRTQRNYHAQLAISCER